MRIDLNFARDIIRCIDRVMGDSTGFSTKPESFLEQPELKHYNASLDALDAHLDHCNERGYFCNFKRNIINGFEIENISQKGYDFLDGKEAMAMQNRTTNFNFNNTTFSNSPIGENITQNTVHGSTFGDNAFIDQSFTNSIGASIQDIEKLISAKSAADQEQLTGLIELLRSVSAKDAPVQKGLLSKFSDCLKKHFDLVTAIGKWAYIIMTENAKQ